VLLQYIKILYINSVFIYIYIYIYIYNGRLSAPVAVAQVHAANRAPRVCSHARDGARGKGRRDADFADTTTKREAPGKQL